MNDSQLRMRELARRVLDVEVGAEPHDLAQAIANAFEKSRFAIAPTIGELGFSAVLNRATWLVGQTVAGGDLEIEGVFGIEALRKIAAARDEARIREWAVAVLAEVLGLLCSFLGEKLTVRIVERVWPPQSQRAGVGAAKPKEGGSRE